MGVIGMRERAALAGGTVDIETAIGHGTVVFVRVAGGSVNGAGR
jgi:signal transduction histidine kinase